MRNYLLRRIATSLLTILGIAVVVFFIVRVLPGDAAAVRAGPYANQELIDRIADKYGLNDPLHIQFFDYIGGVAQGDLGISIRTNQGVTEELLDRLPASLELAVYSVLLATAVGVSLGILAAHRQHTWTDRLARVFAVVGSAMALFWLGLLVTFFFAFRWGWFPGPVDRLAVGSEDPRTFTGFYTIDGILSGRLDITLEAFHYLALPVFTLAFVLAAPILKMVRSAMIETLESDFVRTANAIGVPQRQILFVDGFRNALIPVTTTIGIVFGFMLGGNILVEFIFSWPGIGRYAFDAITTRDLEALQGFVVFVGIMYVFLNMAIDIAYAVIDPRIRLGKGLVK